MTATRDEIERREKSARDAIKRALGTKEDEYGATLFVSHHLAEIEESYWQKHLGTANPEPSGVLDSSSFGHAGATKKTMALTLLILRFRRALQTMS